MTTRPPSPDWFVALSTVHYLSAEQLQTYFHVSPADGLRHPDVLWHRDALWLKSTFGHGRQSAHRRLCAEVYCRLRDLPVTWGPPEQLPGPMPDAIVQFRGRTIYLEADTGKETSRQWETKLTQYQSLTDGALWVVAEGGQRRLAHLGAWLAEARLAIPWQLTALDAVCQIPLVLIEPPAPSTTRHLPETSPAAPSRGVAFQLDGEPVSQDGIQRLISRGLARSQGRELVRGLLIYHFTRRSRGGWARWRRTRSKS